MADQGETAQGTHEEEGGAESGDAPAPTDGQPAAPVEDVEPEIVEDPVSMEKLAVQLKIASAFRLFDHENTNSVDVRWVRRVASVLSVVSSYMGVQGMAGTHVEGGQSGGISPTCHASEAVGVVIIGVTSVWMYEVGTVHLSICSPSVLPCNTTCSPRTHHVWYCAGSWVPSSDH